MTGRRGPVLPDPGRRTGRYFLEVGTPAFQAGSRGSNQYAVLARPTSGSLDV
ncbi:MAG: hypothetical protein R2695_04450 [Acidimicrobiales bacterium]